MPLHVWPLNVVVADVGDVAAHVPEPSMEPDGTKDIVQAWLYGPDPPEGVTVTENAVVKVGLENGALL